MATEQNFGVFKDASEFARFAAKISKEGLTGAAYTRAMADPISYLNGTLDATVTPAPAPAATPAAPIVAGSTPTLYNAAQGQNITGSGSQIYGAPADVNTLPATEATPAQTPAPVNTYANTAQATLSNIYGMASPVMRDVTAPDINSIINSNYAVSNPYTRALLERGMTEGQVPWMLTQEGQHAEEARRIATLQQAVVPQATATMNTALTEVQKQMQKAGKLSSSATTVGMMRTSEQYAANIASTMATGTLSIYDQITQAYNEEADRQLAGATTQAEQETALKTAAVAAEINKYSTEVNAAIAEMQTQTEQRIAQIQADTTLTGYEKDLQVAKLNSETSIKISTAQNAANYKIQKLASETQITTTGMETESAETIAGGWQNIELEKLAETIDQFDVTSEEEREQFWANYNLAVKEQAITKEDKEKTRDLLFAQLQWDKDKYDAMDATQKAQFADNLKLAYDTLAVDEADKKELREIATAQLDNDMKKFWAMSKTEQEQFAQQLEFSNKELLANYTLDKMKLEASLKEQAREFDLTQTADMDKFEKNLQWLKDEQQIDAQTQKDLQATLLKEQNTQFWAKMGQDKTFFEEQLKSTESMFYKQIEWDKDKFSASLNEQIRATDMSDTLERDKMTDTIDMFNAKLREDVYAATEDRALQERMFYEQMTFERANAKSILEEQMRQADLSDAASWENLRLQAESLQDSRDQYKTEYEFRTTTTANDEVYRNAEFEFNKEVTRAALDLQKQQATDSTSIARIDAALAYIESAAGMGANDADLYANGNMIQSILNGETPTVENYNTWVEEYKGTQETALKSYGTLAPKMKVSDYNKLPDIAKQYYTITGGMTPEFVLNDKGKEYNTTL